MKSMEGQARVLKEILQANQLPENKHTISQLESNLCTWFAGKNSLVYAYPELTSMLS